jgi:hypothetical protein
MISMVAVCDGLVCKEEVQMFTKEPTVSPSSSPNSPSTSSPYCIIQLRHHLLRRQPHLILPHQPILPKFKLQRLLQKVQPIRNPYHLVLVQHQLPTVLTASKSASPTEVQATTSRLLQKVQTATTVTNSPIQRSSMIPDHRPYLLQHRQTNCIPKHFSASSSFYITNSRSRSRNQTDVSFPYPHTNQQRLCTRRHLHQQQ